MQTKSRTLESRSFVDIWNSWGRNERSLFYDNLVGLRECTIRNYSTGRRNPTGPSLACIVRTFKRCGYNVGDGRFLFPER